MNTPHHHTTAARSLTSAWVERGRAARARLGAAFIAPGLVKLDAVDQARREYAKAMAEGDRWAEQAAAEDGAR